MLVALGFNRKTHLFLAGSQIYGGRSRLAALTTLYPNLVTKESLLSSSEIQPFMNFTSQVITHIYLVNICKQELVSAFSVYFWVLILTQA